MSGHGAKLAALQNAVSAALPSRKQSVQLASARNSLALTGTAAGGKHGAATQGGVEEEYIRNLQQQIYLLELETRYLKKGGNSANRTAKPPAEEPAETRNSENADTAVFNLTASSLPLNEAIKNLKLKYVELQESHKEKVKRLESKITQLANEAKLARMGAENLEKEKAELARENDSLNRQSNQAEDKVFNEIATLSKRLEVAQAEVARLELSYNRVLQEKERLQASTLQSNLEAAKFRDQVEEQLTVHSNLTRKIDDLQKSNAALQIQMEDQQAVILSFDVDTFKSRIKELQQDKINLQTEVKQMESIRAQQDQLHKRMAEDYNEVVKNNVKLQSELEELRRRYKQETERNEEKFKRRQEDIKASEGAKDELVSLRDTAAMSKIALEARDRKITMMQNQLQDQEVALNKALEIKAVLEDRLLTSENRLKALDTTNLDLVKERTALSTRVAQLQHLADQSVRKASDLRRQRDQLQIDLERFQRDTRSRHELSALLKQVEQSGQNYIHLMKSVRNYVGDAGPDAASGLPQPESSLELDAALLHEDPLGQGAISGTSPEPSDASSAQQLRQHQNQLASLMASYQQRSRTSLDDLAFASVETAPGQP